MWTLHHHPPSIPHTVDSSSSMYTDLFLKPFLKIFFPVVNVVHVLAPFQAVTPHFGLCGFPVHAVYYNIIIIIQRQSQ